MGRILLLLGAALLMPQVAFAVTDSTPPSVGNPTPTTIYRNVPTTISATYTDTLAGVASCSLYVDGISQGIGIMTLSSPGGLSGTATQSYTHTSFTSPVALRVSCTDQASSPNTGWSNTVNANMLIDADAPSIDEILPTTATAGSPTTLSAYFTENGSGLSYCRAFVNGVDVGSNMTEIGLEVSIGYTFASAGTYTLAVTCVDKANNSRTGSSSVTVTAGGGGATATMGTLSPTTATAGSATTFTTTITDTSVKWTVCALYVGGSNVATLTRSGSTVSGSYTFPSAGTFSTYARCQRNDDPPEPVNTATINVVVSAAGGGAVSMGTLSPTTASVGLSTPFSTTITDASGTYNTCMLGIGGALVSNMTRTGSTVSGNYTFVAPGTYNAYVSCWKSTDPTQSVQTSTIIVTASSAGGGADVTPPVVLITAPVGTVVAGTNATVSANYSDNVGVTTCSLTVNGITQGNMTFVAGTAVSGVVTRSYNFGSVGDALVSVFCGDSSGNSHTDNKYVTVAAAGTPPPPPAPTSTDTDSDGLLNTEEATLGTSASNRDTDGDQLSDYEEVRVYHSDPLRRDTDGDGYNDGEEVRNGYSPTGPGTLSGTTPSTGTLIKMPCPVGASVNHPCKAVYFYGRDGKRHPFPHEKTYFSWYPNFGSVQNVSEAAMTALPLGSNVTYRPGVRLVKFQTLNTVYAVTRGGALRALASESVAVAIYGTAWNRQVDDIGDAFFSNYTFGTDITQANQYVPLAETASVLSIDDNF